MIPDAVQRLVRALLDPPSTLNLSAREWNDLVLIGRNAGLLGRISTELKDRGLCHKVPQKARAHLHAALISAESDQPLTRKRPSPSDWRPSKRPLPWATTRGAVSPRERV